MNMFTCYKRFIAKPIFWFICVIYPVCAILGAYLIKNRIILASLNIPDVFIGIMICYGIFFVEVMIDNWVFGGAYVKDSFNLELIKASSKGRKFWKKALVADMLRRLVMIIVSDVVVYIVFVMKYAKEAKEYSFLLFSTSLIFTLLTVYVCRFFQSPVASFAFVYVFFSIELVVLKLLSMINKSIVISLVLLGLSVVVVFVNHYTGVRVFERSYRDE